MGWRVTSLARFVFVILRTGNRFNVNLNGTNRAQMNDTSFVRFRRTGVESDVTVRKKLFSLYKRSGHSYRASFNGTIEHKRMAPFG